MKIFVDWFWDVACSKHRFQCIGGPYDGTKITDVIDEILFVEHNTIHAYVGESVFEPIDDQGNVTAVDYQYRYDGERPR